jgi:hypothetical protein
MGHADCEAVEQAEPFAPIVTRGLACGVDLSARYPLVTSRFRADRALRCALAVIIACAAACAPKTHPQTRVEPPPAALTVPLPPPRLIVPPQPEPVPPATGETEPPASTRPHPPRPAPRPDSRPEPARPESPADPGRPAAPETQPAGQANTDLQPADAAGVAVIRQQMGRASQNMGKVNYATLSPDMRAQFDTASRFLALAEQALKEHNLLFASTLADKAGAIASLLTGR